MRRRLIRLAAAATGALLATAGTVTALSATPAGSAPAADTRQAEFQQVTLAQGVNEVGEPMHMAVLPDGSVLHTSRDGRLFVTDADGNTSVAGELDVYTHDEEGLQSVGVDPDFATNRYIYLYYSPELDTPPGDAPSQGSEEDFEAWRGYNQLSRFTLNEDNTLDLDSEVPILEVETDRGQCCHVGGDIDFDAEGNLYLSTGDDSNPFASDGYTPIDERDGRSPVYDARRSSGNTNDLRGKILRISVNDDGSYDIPEGNLFEPGTPGTRPEIYAMGFRNPFTISVDDATGAVYVGEYGPDAGTADPDRGPAGMVEFVRVTGPGNFGWPFCAADNSPYVEYDFATGESGDAFDCENGPVNESRHNTGLTELPPSQPGWIVYDGGSVPEFGDGSESPTAGPVYNYDPDLDSPVKFPEEYDGDFFAMEFGRQWIKTIEVGEDGSPGAIEDFPWSGTQVMDAAFGPDGALYVLDYGTGWGSGNEFSALYRIEAVGGEGRSPVARASADVTSGPAPLEVAFSSEGSSDPDGDELSYSWDFGDGATSTEANPTHTYTEEGEYTATLTVEDTTGLTASASVYLTVGNTAPTVELNLPADGQIVDFGDEVPFEITVTDPEDGDDIDCSRVTLRFILGHDDHGHELTSATGCSGTLQTLSDGEHDPNANIFGVWDAQYTDSGGLTGHDQHLTQTSQRQAEHFGDASGVEVTYPDGAHGGQAVGGIHDGDWIAFEPYVLADATAFTARAAAGGDDAGGTIEVRAGGPDGTLLGTVDVPAGGDGSFEEVSTELSGAPEGTTTLCLVFTGDTDATLFTLDDFTFTTGGEE